MGPYPYPQPPQQPMLPAPAYAPAAQTDSKAVIALVLGLLSLVCCGGMLLGIPAIVLGFMSKRDISRSGGMLGGDGLAIGGIVTGGLSTLVSIGYIIFMLVAVAAGHASSTSLSSPPYVPTPTVAPYVSPLKSGAIHTVELTRATGDLESQLIGETTSALASGEDVLVYVYARGAKACVEFDAALLDYDMQRVLAHVRFVRVEATEFSSDLATLGMSKTSYPWFWKTDTKLSAAGGAVLILTDSISADEWADNVGYNISPVLEKFMNGSLVKKSAPKADAGVSHLGGITPKGDVSIGAIAGKIPDAQRVITGLRPHFKSCYGAGLASTPTMSGKMELSIDVDANGDVTNATETTGTGLSSDVERCVLARARRAAFAPGAGGTLQVFLSFAPVHNSL